MDLAVQIDTIKLEYRPSGLLNSPRLQMLTKEQFKMCSDGAYHWVGMSCSWKRAIPVSSLSVIVSFFFFLFFESQHLFHAKEMALSVPSLCLNI